MSQKDRVDLTRKEFVNLREKEEAMGIDCTSCQYAAICNAMNCNRCLYEDEPTTGEHCSVCLSSYDPQDCRFEPKGKGGSK